MRNKTELKQTNVRAKKTQEKSRLKIEMDDSLRRGDERERKERKGKKRTFPLSRNIILEI